MTVMCYLACLAIGALILIDRAVEQLDQRPVARGDGAGAPDRRTPTSRPRWRRRRRSCSGRSGHRGRRPFSTARPAPNCSNPGSAARNLEDLPIPRLIRVTVDDAAPPDFEALAQRLCESVKGASLDTHRRWQAELTRMAGALSTLAYAVLPLICVSAVAIVVFATRAVLEANRQHRRCAASGRRARQLHRAADRRPLSQDRTCRGPARHAGLGFVTFFLLGLIGPIGGRRRCRRQPRPALRATRASPWRSYALLLRGAGDRDADQPGDLAHHAHAHAGDVL